LTAAADTAAQGVAGAGAGSLPALLALAVLCAGADGCWGGGEGHVAVEWVGDGARVGCIVLSREDATD
jgi:hypothetical protein